MRRDDLYLSEIVESADVIRRWLSDVPVDRWAEDELLRSAVLQKLTVIGEAARAMDTDLKLRHPRVPWSRIVGFRNVAIHEYFAVDWPSVRRLAQDRVPELRGQIMAVLRAEFPDVARRIDEERR